MDLSAARQEVAKNLTYDIFPYSDHVDKQVTCGSTWKYAKLICFFFPSQTVACSESKWVFEVVMWKGGSWGCGEVVSLLLYCVDSVCECGGNRGVVVTRCIKTWQLSITQSVVSYVCCINLCSFLSSPGKMIHVQCCVMLLLSRRLVYSEKVVKCNFSLNSDSET